ncbi:MAG: non-canonical purine NTP pyrophosphatase [Verrucomicrobiota bacterium]|nr:MAG: non-canonical purine NTP pyrophosphatase [Verrucomicrobiota bacterium]
MKQKLCIASMNSEKLEELNQLLGGFFELLSLKDFPTMPEAEEPYDDFLRNAAFKARHYANTTNMLTLSEDAGLCIDALNGFPGVFTKRFITQSKGLANAYNQLEELLSIKSDRGAHFICEAVFYDPVHDCYFRGLGIMSGKISFPARGNHGFGFDPVFIPEHYDQTIAELGPKAKQTIGHRGQAIHALLENYQRHNVTDISLS